MDYEEILKASASLELSSKIYLVEYLIEEIADEVEKRKL